jgi:cytochrome P450
LGTLALLRQPDQGALLRDSDDPAFIRNAVDDLVRFITIVHHGNRRLALEDIEVDGVQIREGDAVIIALEAANRAPGLVDAPERLDFERKMTNHVAFGGGAHVCLGQHLARVELSEAYQGLLRRFPDLRLAVPFEGLHFLEEFVVYGVESVPLTWG